MDNLRRIGQQEQNIVGMEFFPKGCTWTLDLNPDLGTSNYQIHVTIFARREPKIELNDDDASPERTGTTTYIVATSLFDKEDKSLASKRMPGFEQAKETFDLTVLAVRKAVVKCEFPRFPEGLRVVPSTGEAKLFKEVYKLKAMVRTAGCF
jgi:hypothetical protein